VHPQGCRELIVQSLNLPAHRSDLILAPRNEAPFGPGLLLLEGIVCTELRLLRQLLRPACKTLDKQTLSLLSIASFALAKPVAPDQRPVEAPILGFP
jgi:hypothetical protein